MSIADRTRYLAALTATLRTTWPSNRTVNIVFHGHSVPAGYFRTPVVQSFSSYPHLVHLGLAEIFPFAVINCIVTAIGGENSESGEHRFKNDVLCHKPDLLVIDYALNDIGIGLERSERSLRSMIKTALENTIPIILVTPSHVLHTNDVAGHEFESLRTRHATQVRQIAGELEVGLADADAAFSDYLSREGMVSDLLSQGNHPNHLGHGLIARQLLRWFPIE